MEANDSFGKLETVDLIENGRNVSVTDSNKQEFVQLYVEHKLTKSVEKQLEGLLSGFYSIISPESISIFNESELSLLISGSSQIDMNDWKANTEYKHGYTEASDQIAWFWRLVEQLSEQDRALLLLFATGSSKVPQVLICAFRYQ